MSGPFSFGASKRSERGTGAAAPIPYRIVDWLLAAAAVGGILAASPYAAEVHQFPKTVVFASLTLLAALLWVLARLREGRLAFRSFPGMKALAALVGVAFLVAVSSADRGRAFLGNPDGSGISFVGVASLAIFVFLIRQRLTTPAAIRRATAAVGIGAAVAFLFFIGRVFLPLPPVFARLGLSLVSRAPSETAAFAAAAAGLALATLSELRGRRLAMGVWAGSGVLALAVVTLIGTQRAWAGVAVAAAAVLVRTLLRERSWRGITAAIAVAILLASVPLTFFGTPRQARLALPSEIAIGLNDSWTLARAAAAAGVKPFLLGNGFGSYPETFAAFRPARLDADPMAFSAFVLAPAGAFFDALVEGGLLFLIALLVAAIAVAVGLARSFGAGEAGGIRSHLRPLVRSASPSTRPDAWPLAVGLLALVAAEIVALPSFALVAFGTLLAAIGLAAQGAGKEIEIVPGRRMSTAVRGTVAIVTVVVLLAPVVTLARVAASEAFFGQAIRAFANGDAARAEADIDRAAAIRPDPRYRLGLAQIKSAGFAVSKDAPGAVAALKAAAAVGVRDPAYWIAFMGAAAPVAQSGDKDAAAALTGAADRAVAISPAHPLVLLLAGDAYALVGDKDGAGARYARAVSLKPDYADAFLRLAQLAVDAKDLTTARDLALQAVRSAPANRSAMVAFVNVSLARNAPGDADAAVAAILGYLQAVPNDAGAIATLGQLLERAGRPADAKQTYLRLKQVAPDTAGLDDRLRAIDAAIASSSASTTVK